MWSISDYIYTHTHTHTHILTYIHTYILARTRFAHSVKHVILVISGHHVYHRFTEHSCLGMSRWPNG